MTVKELIDTGKFKLINVSDDSREIDKIFCCDLLSIAMSKAPVDSAWVTCMANVNTLAVASLADVSVVILAESSQLDEDSVSKAKEQEINVLATAEPIFDTGLLVRELLND